MKEKIKPVTSRKVGMKDKVTDRSEARRMEDREWR